MDCVQETTNDFGLPDGILAEGLDAEQIGDLIDDWSNTVWQIETTILLGRNAQIPGMPRGVN